MEKGAMMQKFWYIGLAVVTVIALIKTGLIVTIVLDPAQVNLVLVSGLFVLFFALTSGVAYFCVTQLNAHLQGVRKKRLTPGASEPVAKETVIARYAPEWGLSQAEADVAIFVAKGFSNSEVADMRNCAVATVKSQLGSIYQKSGLDSRYQLIAFVTDEVCAMAKQGAEGETDQSDIRPIETRSILPLPGRGSASARTASPAEV